jgi:photosystem II stability/assembly factor-like uncharacterized protein
VKKHRFYLIKLIAYGIVLALLSYIIPSNSQITQADDQLTIDNYQLTIINDQLPITNYPPSSTLQTPPDIPTIIDQLYLGIPAGNGHDPQRVVVDNQRRRLYTLNNGLSQTGQGNTLSVIDLQTKQVINLLTLNPPAGPGLIAQPDDALLSPSRVLDLQLDPYRPRLYALTGDLYASPPYSNLTVIDLNSLTVINTLPGVLALTATPDRLYMVNATHLWSADPDSLTELGGIGLQYPTSALQSVLVNPATNRLYLSSSANLQVFSADTFTAVNVYTPAAELKQISLDPANNRVLIIDSDGAALNLRALDSDGRPVPVPAPFLLTDDTYSDPRLALIGSQIAVANRTFDTYSLQIFNGADLSLTTALPIPGYPTHLAADAAAGQVYLSYNSPGHFVLPVDLASQTSRPIYTALTILDALADPANGRLYILNDQGTIQLLNLTNYQEIARLETGNTAPFRLKRLALDPARGRLYLSGSPAQVIDTETLQIVATLDTPGQLTPDPASDRLYLTPPCNCRREQCNTLMLNTATLTGTATLFPPQDVFAAPCVVETNLDETNRLLYAQIYNGVPGSNSGHYFSVFDVAGLPKELYTAGDISFGRPALDPLRRRAFVARYRMSQPFLNRFEAQGQSFTQTLQVNGAGGALTYDPTFDRLYAVSASSLQVYDGDLALLSEITLPGIFNPLTFDPQTQRLYLTDSNANLLVVATSGGQLEAPPPPRAEISATIPAPPQLFVAPTGAYFQINYDRLYRAINNNQNWEIIGRGLPARTITALAISPNYPIDRTLLVGMSGPEQGGSLYRSTDGGDTWQPITRGLTDLQIKQIVFSPTFAQDQTIFVGTQSNGLYRSSDGGNTWTGLASRYTSDPTYASLNGLAVSPNFANDRLVLISANTIYRSSDGGATWRDTGLPPGLIAFSPNFATDRLILSEGRWRSSDGGQSWQPSAAGLAPNRGVKGIYFSPNFSSDQAVYLLTAQDYDQPNLLQRSVDAGRTWQSLLAGLPPNFALAGLTLLPSGELYLSPNQGQPITLLPQNLTWGRPTADITQLDWQDLVVGPDGAIYVANPTAGVLKSSDSGRTWQEPNFPARAADISTARLAIANNGTLFAAVGTILERSADGGQSWSYLSKMPPGFEVTALAVSPSFAPDGIVLVGGNYQTKQILRSADGGQNWQVVFDASQRSDYADVSALAFSPNFAGDRTVYAWLQYAGLLRSTDGGQSWAIVPSDKSSIFAQALLVGPNGRLYLGALGGGLYISDNSGQSWLDLTPAIPDNRQWSQTLALDSTNTLYLGTDTGVYRSPDNGQSWNRASNGLPLDPNNPPQGVRALRLGGQRLYAALVQGGVYVSVNQGQSWQSSATAPAQPAAIPTPLPAPTQTVQPTPACPNPPANFANIWSSRVAQLGCPTNPLRVLIVEQSFERGLMFWRGDTKAIYVLPTSQAYAAYADTWADGQPVYSCPEAGPPQTPPTPQRGFGKVWCSQPQVRPLLGNAVSAERPYEALAQEFTTGLIFQTDQGLIYVLESGTRQWERVQ